MSKRRRNRDQDTFGLGEQLWSDLLTALRFIGFYPPLLIFVDLGFRFYDNLTWNRDDWVELAIGVGLALFVGVPSFIYSIRKDERDRHARR